MRYPVTADLAAGIEKLFETPATAFDFLGALEEMSGRAGSDHSLSLNASSADRARMLRRKLETYIVQMASESEELGDAAETLRLRAESVGTLIALRELWLHFPEAFEQPSK